MSAPQASVKAFIGVGANLGFSRDAVLNALADLARLPRTEFVAASSLYRSAPIDSSGPDFINAVAEIDTELPATDLLAHLWSLELQAGRVRTERNAPRTLDLDLLLYGDLVINTAELTVPHKSMRERAFVLKPLLELAPDIEIPQLGLASALLPHVLDQDIERLEP
jgi:2-amino-4-hydroxy-6-hydroxymethyldihydropteridine diphosphokinase